MTMSNFSYFSELQRPTDALVRPMVAALEGVKYDTIIGTGMSGALIVPVVARELGKNWALIRKEGELSHSGAVYEGTIGDRWIIVDDFISSGATVVRILQRVKLAWEGVASYRGDVKLPEFLGVYQYTDQRQTFTHADTYTLDNGGSYVARGITEYRTIKDKVEAYSPYGSPSRPLVPGCTCDLCDASRR